MRVLSENGGAKFLPSYETTTANHSAIPSASQETDWLTVSKHEEKEMAENSYWKTPIAEGCFMVGRRNPHSLLQCNTYLRRFEWSGHSPVFWCVDPGSQLDYQAVRSHLLDHVGELAALRLCSVNHQDPDVVGNLIPLTHEHPRLATMVTEDVWRLVRHLDVNVGKLHFVNQSSRNRIGLPSGQQLHVVPTPFCHFRGAMAFYDPESQVLFSGDLFGGLNVPGRVQIHGEEEDWPGIAQFHQIYMPSRVAVAFAIRQVRALKPEVKFIAPQHGFVLSGDFMHSVLDRLERLPVGLDILPSEFDDSYLDAYNSILHDLLDVARARLGNAEAIRRLQNLPADHELSDCLKVTGRDVRLTHNGIRALPLVIHALSDKDPTLLVEFRSAVLKGCTHLGAPIPQLGIGLGETGDVGSLNQF